MQKRDFYAMQGEVLIARLKQKEKMRANLPWLPGNESR
jgi:hypothetical protein